MFPVFGTLNKWSPNNRITASVRLIATLAYVPERIYTLIVPYIKGLPYMLVGIGRSQSSVYLIRSSRGVALLRFVATDPRYPVQ